MILKTIDNSNQDHSYLCEHIFSELTALCPLSGLPDFYTVIIKYEPKEYLIELKSLKLYLINFRDQKLLHEQLANKILNDFVSIVKPKYVCIELDVNVRGGIQTKILVKWPII